MPDWTSQRNGCTKDVELHTSLVADNRPRKTGGIFVPGFCPAYLWREAGSGNAPACPLTGVTSRRQMGLTASLATFINVLVEADMTNDPDGRNASDSLKDNLNLYLAFLDMEARYVRHMLNYDRLEGVFTPVYGRINQLYPDQISECAAVLHGRAQTILAKLEVVK
jgi:hypothetical protein